MDPYLDHLKYMLMINWSLWLIYICQEKCHIFIYVIWYVSILINQWPSVISVKDTSFICVSNCLHRWAGHCSIHNNIWWKSYNQWINLIIKHLIRKPNQGIFIPSVLISHRMVSYSPLIEDLYPCFIISIIYVKLLK